jgi:hypothetical protein
MSVIRELGLKLQKRARELHSDSLLGSQGYASVVTATVTGGANRIGRDLPTRIVDTATDVGTYTRSASPNGTFDQGGNVRKWTEAVIFGLLRALLHAYQNAFIICPSEPGELNTGLVDLEEHARLVTRDRTYDDGIRVAPVVDQRNVLAIGREHRRVKRSIAKVRTHIETRGCDLSR